jgi:hypothetical protein
MIYILMYLSAIVAANLLVTRFGPSIAVLNAFLFIGLDLSARDNLHDAWHGRGLVPRMAALIGAGSVLSYALNRNAGQIALASFVAFALAASADTLAYHLLGERARLIKVNGSNVVSAAVDSFAFPALAFGFPLLFGVMAGQFLAKVGGGFLWSLLLARRDWRTVSTRIVVR